MKIESSSAEELFLRPGPWRHRSVNANGSQFHYVEIGAGPLVLLLHGFPDFWWTWRHQLPTLAASGFRTVAMDLRGYGASDKPPRGYDGYTLASDVVGVIRALGEDKAILIGHDWGAFLAQVAGVLFPENIDGIGILGSAHPLRLRRAMATDRRQLLALRHIFSFQLPRFEHIIARNNARYIGALLTRWAGSAWRRTEDFSKHFAADRQMMSSGQTAFCAVEYHRWAIRSLMRRHGWRFASLMRKPLEMPILHIQGTHDNCILPSTARGGSLFAGSSLRYRELPDIGHYPHCEAPEEVTRTLIEWLERVTD